MYLGLITVVLFTHRHAGPGLMDGFYWLGAVGIVACRYLDVAHFAGETADGKPASMSHWGRHALWVIAAALALWLAVRLPNWL